MHTGEEWIYWEPLTETTFLGQPGRIITACMSCFSSGGPDKERGTNKLPPARIIWEGPKEGGDTSP